MKRHILNKSWTRIFLAPDGESSGGGSGNPGANQGGGAASSAGGGTVNLFEGVDLNDLDPEARKAIEKANASFATLQKEKAELTRKSEESARNERAYQSQLDQTKAQLQKLTGGGQSGLSPEEQQKEAEIGTYAKMILDKSPGLDPKVAKTQAEMMFDMMGERSQRIKQEIGRDFAPFAQNLLGREATYAFQEAAQNDAVGALQNDDIAAVVWGQCQEMVKHGQQVTTEVVQNLAGMEFYKQVNAGKLQMPNQPPTTPTVIPTRTFPHIGRQTTGGNAPIRQQTTFQGSTLNSDGQKAIQAVLGQWGDAAKKAPDYIKK